MLQVQPDESFMEAGLDSMGAVKLQNRISRHFGIADLPTTLTFDHPTPAAVAAYVTALARPPVASINQLMASGSLQMMQGENVMLATSEIAGVSCRFPVDTNGLEGFWDTVTERGDVQRVVPAERWDMDAVYNPEVVPGKSFVKVR